MNTIKIPKEFQIFGETITVESNDALTYKEGLKGMTLYRENRIVLQLNNEGASIPQDSIEQTFFHEMLHFVLDKIKEDELREDEKLVDLISSALHQVFKTAKY